MYTIFWLFHDIPVYHSGIPDRLLCFQAHCPSDKSISSTLTDIRESQDYSLRVSVERKDEIGRLAVEVNNLIDYIETEIFTKPSSGACCSKRPNRMPSPKFSTRNA